jgi:DNA helicase-2/ATP-dependent DNA helicase PcrA
MEIEDFLEKCSSLPGRTYPPDDYQKGIIRHDKGPMWVIAGPGSGKTDSIALRAIKLLIIDHVEPKAIIVTTFTEKAAINLKNRITSYMEAFRLKDPSIRIDYTALRTGTLHSLCSDIMHEFRFKEFQNVRILNDHEQLLFILEHSDLARIYSTKTLQTDEENKFWRTFYYLGSYNTAVKAKPSREGNISRIQRAEITQTLFNRIVEYGVDIGKLKTAGGVWKTLADQYERYVEKLRKFYRSDFSHIQLSFIKFLNSQQSKLFLKGDGTKDFPGIDYVLVDEYQDTNPIQEEIYLKLGENGQHNICVVGDDDQALYRFRGGTVDCMIEFPEVVAARWNGTKVTKFDLPINYRSHPKIVNYCNEFIKSFDVMNVKGARSADKKQLEPRSKIKGDYPAVALHTGKNINDSASTVAELIYNIKKNGILKDYSEAAILLRSTKESPRNAGPYVEALRAKNVPHYNPRSKALLEQEEVMALLGTFVKIVDPDLSALNAIKYEGVQERVISWISAASPYMTGALKEYVDNSISKIRLLAAQSPVGVNILDILYHILSYEPFSKWIEDKNRAVRIGVVTQIFDAFLSVPSSLDFDPKKGPIMMGSIYTSRTSGAGISWNWRMKFYTSLVAILSSKGVDEPESIDEDFPKGMVPIMTVHQAKGLEFPFVFVGSLGNKVGAGPVSSELILENDLRPFRTRPISNTTKLTPDEKTIQDSVRFFYVANSRAMYALVLVASNNEIRSKQLGVGFGGKGIRWLESHVEVI